MRLTYRYRIGLALLFAISTTPILLGIQVSSAWYGDATATKAMKDNQCIDVTTIVKALPAGSSIPTAGKTFNAMFTDPNVGTAKALFIKYSDGTIAFAEEGSTITLDASKQVAQALYGNAAAMTVIKNGNCIDVTSTVKAQTAGSTIPSGITFNALFGRDPHIGVAKALFIKYSDGTIAFAEEGSTITLPANLIPAPSLSQTSSSYGYVAAWYGFESPLPDQPATGNQPVTSIFDSNGNVSVPAEAATRCAWWGTPTRPTSQTDDNGRTFAFAIMYKNVRIDFRVPDGTALTLDTNKADELVKAYTVSINGVQKSPQMYIRSSSTSYGALEAGNRIDSLKAAIQQTFASDIAGKTVTWGTPDENVGTISLTAAIPMSLSQTSSSYGYLAAWYGFESQSSNQPVTSIFDSNGNVSIPAEAATRCAWWGTPTRPTSQTNDNGRTFAFAIMYKNVRIDFRVPDGTALTLDTNKADELVKAYTVSINGVQKSPQIYTRSSSTNHGALGDGNRIDSLKAAIQQTFTSDISGKTVTWGTPDENVGTISLTAAASVQQNVVGVPASNYVAQNISGATITYSESDKLPTKGSGAFTFEATGNDIYVTLSPTNANVQGMYWISLGGSGNTKAAIKKLPAGDSKEVSFSVTSPDDANPYWGLVDDSAISFGAGTTVGTNTIISLTGQSVADIQYVGLGKLDANESVTFSDISFTSVTPQEKTSSSTMSPTSPYAKIDVYVNNELKTSFYPKKGAPEKTLKASALKKADEWLKGKTITKTEAVVDTSVKFTLAGGTGTDKSAQTPAQDTSTTTASPTSPYAKIDVYVNNELKTSFSPKKGTSESILKASALKKADEWLKGKTITKTEAVLDKYVKFTVR